METLIVTRKAYDVGSIGKFIDVVTEQEPNLNFSASLDDMNVIPNKYNHHKAFRKYKDARAYLDKCLSSGGNR